MWYLVCKPTKKGGLGIKNLKLFNYWLLCKWWWKLENEKRPMANHCQKEIWYSKWHIHSAAENKMTVVWKDLIKVEYMYLFDRSMVIGDGKATDF
jgi:hypothetical protein